MSFLGTVAGGVVSSAGQYLTNLKNIEANAERFSAQTNLANTAHQREVLDLEAAGLNPILSATSSGASTPSLNAYQAENPAESTGRSIQSATRLARLDMPLKESQIAINSAQAENLRAQGELFKAEAKAVKPVTSVIDAAPTVGSWLGDKFYNWFHSSDDAGPSSAKSLIPDPNKHPEEYKRYMFKLPEIVNGVDSETRRMLNKRDGSYYGH